jgi:hypothetical protein
MRESLLSMEYFETYYYATSCITFLTTRWTIFVT